MASKQTHCKRGHEFTEKNTYVDPRGQRLCRECRNLRQRQFVERHPGYDKRYSETRREWYQQRIGKNLWTNYRLRLEDFEALLAKQNGACAICAEACITGRRLAVDHDHASGKVRGLLCSRCNQGIGQFRDRPELLERAAAYLMLGH